MPDKQYFQTQDLVLKVSETVDPKVFDIGKYEAFLDVLCGPREYQKEAIRVALRYLLGKQYGNLRELAKENYRQNPVLQSKYSAFTEFQRHLQLPDKLACSIDLATATGKSYMIYGIARIMLAEGAVDQVLVLCPSNTIEAGLADKFKALSGYRTLKDLLPPDAKVRNPRIIHADQTVKAGDIVIENIHATYARTKSAIEDSLKGKGARTLVLNDEAHHIFNPTDRALKKWKEFLLDSDYGFYYIVGDTGTAYIKDEYFNDVVYRYSLRQAIEDGFAKTIDYVAEDSSGIEAEKFQKIYDNHRENKEIKYRKVKSLTIMVTKNIAECRDLTARWIEFLAQKEKISKKVAEEKVLIVTSANEHRENVLRLDEVDKSTNPIEWITSVSMLTEGWDVEKVFQIVPHEKRAFNSKLLIAQVLGRGLRIPQEYKGERPVVKVFNHDKWSQSIKHLVEEVLEIEKKLSSYPIPARKQYNFSLCNIDYEKAEVAVEVPQKKEYELLKKGYIAFSSQAPKIEKETVYERVLTGERERKKTIVEYEMFSLEEVARHVQKRLYWFDQEAGTNYSKKFPRKKLLEILKKSLRRVGEKEDRISEENRQKALHAFDVIRRQKAKALRHVVKAKDLIRIDTADVKRAGLGVGNLRRDASVFYDDFSLQKSEADDQVLLRELEADETLPRSALQKIANSAFFKASINHVFASHKPEREFVKRLMTQENAEAIDSWIKSRDVGFYSIEYAWRKGEHWKVGRFNPDFFIRIGKDILAIELKGDADVSGENKAKLKYAVEHFAKVNELQKKQRYFFKFISPQDYDLFFQSIRDKNYRQFVGALHAELK